MVALVYAYVAEAGQSSYSMPSGRRRLLLQERKASPEKIGPKFLQVSEREREMEREHSTKHACMQRYVYVYLHARVYVNVPTCCYLSLENIKVQKNAAVL